MTQTMIEVFESIKEDVKSATDGVDIATETFESYYLPLIQYYIGERERRQISHYVIGIQGCQGVGKTVLTTLIKNLLRSANYKIEGFSIDDFYKSYDDRLQLYRTLQENPFYRVRGVPGTHRHQELIAVLEKAKSGDNFDIPVFDKSLRDNKGDISDKVIQVRGPQDFIILEGWCVNMPYVEPSEFPSIMLMNEYVNSVFNEMDPNHEHFKVVLDYISKYQRVWGMLDNKTIMLGREIEWIEPWRFEQEERRKSVKGSGMTRQEVHEFVKPYIPFTWLFYDRIARDPRTIDSSMEIGWNHIPTSINLSDYK